MQETEKTAAPTALEGSMRDFRNPGGRDLLARVEGFYAWQNLRRENGLWPLGRSTDHGPHRRVTARSDSGDAMQGINFASQDYLGLATEVMARLGIGEVAPGLAASRPALSLVASSTAAQGVAHE